MKPEQDYGISKHPGVAGSSRFTIASTILLIFLISLLVLPMILRFKGFEVAPMDILESGVETALCHVDTIDIGAECSILKLTLNSMSMLNDEVAVEFRMFQSDGVSIGDPVYGSSLSSNSKGSRSRVSSDQYPNHHHSVSDGALSYFGSPAESFQAARWTPPVQKVNFEFATPSAGVNDTFEISDMNTDRLSIYFSDLHSMPDSFINGNCIHPVPVPNNLCMHEHRDPALDI
ncbi:zinc finger protein [Cinnamomum micranthum f. kanehirae]|uniref:Zinc finger protein n=1 Tax=Cinnamomum micranthum f. kanehirae TaxID=337451 RepID=A0A443PM79_9MAGN|nr:zinc finger protein [Cinnamomum micranthum f. kanehirae]